VIVGRSSVDTDTTSTVAGKWSADKKQKAAIEKEQGLCRLGKQLMREPRDG
jgi:hypothetical protein